VTAFFIPDGPGQAGEDVYQRLRKETETQNHGGLDAPGQP
jgi:hypothetical protein